MNDWLKYFNPDEGDTNEMRKYILVDPASSKKKGSDYTVIAVLGLGARIRTTTCLMRSVIG
jgi:hypothetical protein